MATQIKESELTKVQLVKLIKEGGELKGVGKMRAIAMLNQRRLSDVSSILEDIIRSRTERPHFKRMAVMGLYEQGGVRAERDLIRVARHADDTSAAAVALGLGRLGGVASLPLIKELSSAVPRHLKEQINFAASLVSYRNGLDSNTVRTPSSNQLQSLGRKRSSDISFAKASQAMAKAAIQTLEMQPIDVQLTTSNAQRIICSTNTFVWLWSESAQGGVTETARDKNTVAGLLFRKNQFDKNFSLSLIGLTTPRTSGIRLTLHRATSGKIMYTGIISTDGKAELFARKHPGMSAISLKAVIKGDNAIQIARGKSAIKPLEANRPKEA